MLNTKVKWTVLSLIRLLSLIRVCLLIHHDLHLFILYFGGQNSKQCTIYSWTQWLGNENDFYADVFATVLKKFRFHWNSKMVVVFPVKQIPFLLPPFSTRYQQVVVGTHNGCTGIWIEIQFHQISTDRYSITVHSNLLNRTCLEIEWVCLIITVQWYAFLETNDSLLGLLPLNMLSQV